MSMLHHPRFFALAALAALASPSSSQNPSGQNPSGQNPSSQKPAPRQDQEPSIHALFDGILKNRVQSGIVEYPEIRKHNQGTLRTYLNQLAQVDVIKLGKKEQFAFYVNLYNASMIQAVLDHTAKNKKWKPSASEFAVFKEKRVRLSSGVITLDDLENKILRPKFGDHRVHVALVCGARSCPPLLSRAYRAKDLDKVLDANFKRFLRDTSRNRIDVGKKTIYLSKLFEWFQADFGGEVGVRQLLKEEFGDTVSRYKIAYLDYSWELNDRAAKK